MRHPNFIGRLLLLVAALALPSATALGQASSGSAAEPKSEADRQFEVLRTRFVDLFESLRNTRGMLPEDRSVVEGFRGQVDGFLDTWPDHAGGVAIALQLARWVNDQERINALYKRLMELEPEDPRIALSWLKQWQRSEDATEEAVFGAYRDLYARFPDSPELLNGWARQLKNDERYDEAIAILRAADPDPAESPESAYLLADALFAQHQFAEASERITAIEANKIRDPRLRTDIQRNTPVFEEYVDLWAKEQEIRQAEAEADDLPLVEIYTPRGRILVELFENEAPNTVANFVSLAQSGFYHGTKFHRYMPDFMIQGGDPFSRDGAEGTPGQGNPGYLIPDEHVQENHRNHFRDSIAMAKSPAPNSAGCQFYLDFRPTPWLNGKHTVFGRVVEGLDVARSLRADDEIVAINVLRTRDHPYEPSTLPVDAASPMPASPAPANPFDRR